MLRSWPGRVGLAFAAGAVAFLINSLVASTPTPMLGRLVTLPIAIIFGPGLGAIAAVLGGVALRSAPNAPLLILALLAEAVVVGRAAERHKSPVLVDGFVWTIVALIIVA